MRNDPYKDYGWNLHHNHNHEHLPEPPKPTLYSNIQKGTSCRIPVAIRTQDGEPVDLSNMKVYFTMKKRLGDPIHDDGNAVILREFTPQDPIGGTFFVLLTPQETYLKPGYYFFDFELAKGPMVNRLGTFMTQIVEGVTNRSVIDSEYAEDLEDGELIPEEELDIILITEETKTDTIVVLTNFGQLPIVVNNVESVNGQTGNVNLVAGDVNAYTKEETDEKINALPQTVNGKTGNVEITLEELGGVTPEQVKEIAHDIALDLYKQFM